jgi:7-cyano-7-deazaguanine tRNA-ribosyltransferase
VVEFEIRDRDLLARIGRLETKSGTVETPAFLPVVNMAKQSVTPRELWSDFGCRMLITNAYIVRKQQADVALNSGVHKFLDFPGVVMTDSGAYQILAYGKVDVTPEEIIRFQEQISTDIATILDVPTGWGVSRQQAQRTVEETVKRAKQLETQKSRSDIGWVGPVQGGRYLDLVAESAQQMAELPFDLYALGSPTPVMEQYLFDLLVDMIVTAKMNLPPNRPLHLFGAGHPFMFAFAVALGCDLFDSAAYAMFAKDNRYLTSHGTIRLANLKHLPCSCPVCTKRDPDDLANLPKTERERELCRHNLYVCFAEIRRVKQAVAEGRLWEHLEMQAHSHPSLYQALKQLGKYSEYIERHSPAVKRSGLFYYSSAGLARPEVVHYRKRLLERYTRPKKAKILVLLPEYGRRHVRKSKKIRNATVLKYKELSIKDADVHECVYAPPFGVIPPELKEVYPLSQYEYAVPPDRETVEYMAQRIIEYAETMKYSKVAMLVEPGSWQETAAETCSSLCLEKKISFTTFSLKT